MPASPAELARLVEVETLISEHTRAIADLRTTMTDGFARLELQRNDDNARLDKQMRDILAAIEKRPILEPPSFEAQTSTTLHSGILGTAPTKEERTPSAPSARLFFPRYATGDPSSWILNVEFYFKYHQTPASDMLVLVPMHLDPPASIWFQGLEAEGGFPSWAAFTVALTRRFGPSEFEDPTAQLAKLTQSTTVPAYQAAFEAVAARVRGFSPHHLCSFFISGLKPRIKMSVQAHRPRDIHEAFSLARLYEAQRTSNGLRPYPPRPPAPTLPGTSTAVAPFRRLPPEEQLRRRELGLCFNCDEKFVRGHQCKARATVLLLDGTENDSQPIDTSEPPFEHDKADADITLCALSSGSTSRAMRLLGSMQKPRFCFIFPSTETRNQREKKSGRRKRRKKKEGLHT